MLYMMYLYSLSFVSWQLTHAKTVKFLACILKVNIFATLAKGTFCLTLIQDAFLSPFESPKMYNIWGSVS